MRNGGHTFSTLLVSDQLSAFLTQRKSSVGVKYMREHWLSPCHGVWLSRELAELEVSFHSGKASDGDHAQLILYHRALFFNISFSEKLYQLHQWLYQCINVSLDHWINDCANWRGEPVSHPGRWHVPGRSSDFAEWQEDPQKDLFTLRHGNLNKKQI